MKRIEDYWYSQNPVAWLLLPVSWLYCSLALTRRFLYRTGILSVRELPVPVVIVGNINVGGTGKTPLLIALCDLLLARGYKPGIVSRGYGGTVSGVKLVDIEDAASLVGDEPLLLAKRTHCPVAVGADRVAAARLLLNHQACGVLLSDDGLQHYRMGRDYEIAVIDVRRYIGNGFCLPAGPLREPSHRLNSVDLKVLNGGAEEELSFCLKLDNAVNLTTGETIKLEALSAKTLHAVAGIGHPLRFFDQLSVMGLTFSQHAFPDHHRFRSEDFTFAAGSMVLMTEKDAVKCRDLELTNAWYVPAITKLSVALQDRLKKDFDELLN